ncbi:LPXTG cell wall anchor domain-containing protein [Patescibacteria group bacterium]|nr:MAG: LPXTG cell wall anchor domain-containing protein [Patescibacteria group bacterium]
MDSLTSGTPNPTNNPRMNLLNGSGTNNQINTTSANAYEASAFHARPVPAPNPVNQTPLATSMSTAPKASYVRAAAKKAPEATPKPAPAPTPAETPPPPPEPRPVPNAPEPPKRRWPLVVGLIVLLLVAVGAAIGWWFLNQPKKEQPKAPTKEVEAVNPTSLKQLTASGEAVAAGGTVQQKSVKLSFTIETDANSGSVTPEVEVRPIGTPFTGEATHTGSAVSANGSNLNPSVTVDNLDDGQYQWQARAKVGDQASEWVQFGGATSTTPAFIVQAAAAKATAVQSVSGVAVANPTNVTTANPVFSGTSEPNSTVTVTVDGKSFKATSNSSGNWTVTADQSIANGQHQVTVVATDGSGATVGQTQLTLVVAVAAATPEPVASSSAPAATSTAPAATTNSGSAASSSSLAATGDNAVILSLAGAAAMAVSLAGLVWARRRYATFF